MTDIVKMLRMGVTSIGVRKGDFPYYDDLMNKAADEIERLKKELYEARLRLGLCEARAALEGK